MASVYRRSCRHLLAVSALTFAAAGCGESFVATGGAGGEGGTTGGGGSGASGTTSSAGECEEGTTKECYDGPDDKKNVGICKAGKVRCEGGKWSACKGQVFPEAKEICDEAKKDENCDGSANDGCACEPGEEISCYEGLEGTLGVGPCKAGKQTCVDGKLSKCEGQVLPEAKDKCDAIDQDCDGDLEDAPEAGEPCETNDVGVCAAGTKQCVDAELKCVQKVAASAEVCDGEDDDCNGEVDDLAPTPCTVGAGMCSGHKTCEGGTEICAAVVYLFETFSTVGDDTWSLGPQWQIGAIPPPQGLPDRLHGDPATDVTLGNDNQLAGVVLGGPPAAQLEPSYLTSKVFDTSEAPSLYLSYWRWLKTDMYEKSPHTVEVSKDGGGTWKVIWNHDGQAITDSAWTLMVHDIGDHRSTQMRIRFGFSQTVSSAPTYGSWNIDDLHIGSCP